MSRIAFFIAGFQANDDPITLDPLNGWFWQNAPNATVTPPDVSHPVIVSAADMVNLAWRIQTVTVTWSINWADNTDSGTTSGTSQNTDEQDIVNLGGQIFANAAGNMDLALDTEDIGVDGMNNLYPYFFLVHISGASISPLFPPAGVPTGMVLTSTSIPSLNGLPIYGAPGLTYSGTINIEATAWWPYASTLSPAPPNPGPIYDATTGETLITPIPTGF